MHPSLYYKESVLRLGIIEEDDGRWVAVVAGKNGTVIQSQASYDPMKVMSLLLSDTAAWLSSTFGSDLDDIKTAEGKNGCRIVSEGLVVADMGVPKEGGSSGGGTAGNRTSVLMTDAPTSAFAAPQGRGGGAMGVGSHGPPSGVATSALPAPTARGSGAYNVGAYGPPGGLPTSAFAAPKKPAP